jgi:hypothetical protein
MFTSDKLGHEFLYTSVFTPGGLLRDGYTMLGYYPMGSGNYMALIETPCGQEIIFHYALQLVGSWLTSENPPS